MGKEKMDNCECCCEEESSSTGMAIEIADKAYMKVLQRKMEAMLEKKNGKGMDKVASIAYEYAMKYYMASMQDKKLSKTETDAYEKRLNDAMMG